MYLTKKSSDEKHYPGNIEWELQKKGHSQLVVKHPLGDWLQKAIAWGNGYRGAWCPKNPSSMHQHPLVGAWSHASEPPHRELMWDYGHLLSFYLGRRASQEYQNMAPKRKHRKNNFLKVKPLNKPGPWWHWLEWQKVCQRAQPKRN